MTTLADTKSLCQQAAREALAALQLQQQEAAAAVAEAESRCADLRATAAETEAANSRLQASRLQVKASTTCRIAGPAAILASKSGEAAVVIRVLSFQRSNLLADAAEDSCWLCLKHVTVCRSCKSQQCSSSGRSGMRVRLLASCGCGRWGRRLCSRWADQMHVVHILYVLSCLGSSSIDCCSKCGY